MKSSKSFMELDENDQSILSVNSQVEQKDQKGNEDEKLIHKLHQEDQTKLQIQNQSQFCFELNTKHLQQKIQKQIEEQCQTYLDKKQILEQEQFQTQIEQKYEKKFQILSQKFEKQFQQEQFKREEIFQECCQKQQLFIDQFRVHQKDFLQSSNKNLNQYLKQNTKTLINFEDSLKNLQSLMSDYSINFDEQKNPFIKITLHQAVIQHKNKILKTLLKNQDPNELNSDGHTPLYTAILCDNQKATQILLNNGAQLMYSEIPKKTLNKASIENDLNAIKLLMFNIEDKNQPSTTEKNRTSLGNAIHYNRREAFKLLLKYNCDVNIKDDQGNLPLHYAYKIGLECYQLLIENGSKINDLNYQGMSPIQTAVLNGTMEEVKFIVSKNADIFQLDKEGRNLLHLAALVGKVEMLNYFLELNLDINQLDHSKQTPLHLAAFYNRAEACQLLAQISNILIEDLNGKKAIDLAKQSNFHKIIEILEKKRNLFFDQLHQYKLYKQIKLQLMKDKRQINQSIFFKNVLIKGLLLGFLAGSAHLITLNVLKRYIPLK